MLWPPLPFPRYPSRTKSIASIKSENSGTFVLCPMSFMPLPMSSFFQFHSVVVYSSLDYPGRFQTVTRCCSFGRCRFFYPVKTNPVISKLRTDILWITWPWFCDILPSVFLHCSAWLFPHYWSPSQFAKTEQKNEYPTTRLICEVQRNWNLD